MTQRTVARLAWAIWVVTLLATVAYEVIGGIAGLNDALDFWLLPALIMGFATVGALIVSRQGDNTIGWLYSLIGLSAAVGTAAAVYGAYGIDTNPSLPGAVFAVWVGHFTFPLMAGPLAFLFLLYPDGKVPTRRWRPLLWIMILATVLVVVGFALAPGSLGGGFTETHAAVRNPFGLPVSRSIVDTPTQIAGLALFVGGLLSVVALALRYRRSEGVERQQIRWLAYVAGIAVAALIAGGITALVRTALDITVSEDEDVVSEVLFFIFILDLLVGIPAASAIAILRYRLYDLDLVVKKTVVVGALVAFMVVVYLGVVALVGGGLGAVVIVALTLLPARRQAQRLADRVVYGKRATPYEVLAEFSDRVADAYSSEDVLPRMAQILAGATGGESTSIWLRVGAQLRPATAFPPANEPGAPLRIERDSLPAFPEGQFAVEVRHQGELLGALSVTMPTNDPIDPPRERLVSDLAAQAGLVLRNVRLIEELRESRRRIVATQDERAKKLERNIHDGAQQQLVGLAVKLRLAQSLVRRDPDKAETLLTDLQAESNDALENLRDLARGIYPPLLADKGLAAALDAQARKSAVPTTVEVENVGRYPQGVEAALYFCALEAMQNVAKYAEASASRLRLAQVNGDLTFEIVDDGRGFDPAAEHGTGLQGMADRLEAIGGQLDVRSAPGEGTTVAGRIPVAGA